MIEVRDAFIDDADAIATAHIDGWRAGYRGVVPDEFLDAEEFASSRRERWQAWTWQKIAESRLFVVTIQGRVVGFCHAGPEETAGQDADADGDGDERRGEIYGFYLHPSAWGSGGAPALMSRCEEFLRDDGFASAILWVLRDNPRARAFYEKAGWHSTGLESTFTPPDAPMSDSGPLQWQVTQYAVRL